LVRLFRTPKFWLLAGVVAVVVVVVPQVAKVPVALGLGVPLVARLLNQKEATSIAKTSTASARSELDRYVTFDGFRGEPGPKRIKWRQVRCVLQDDDLRVVSYWHRRAPGVVVPLRGAVLTQERTSGPGDWNLKPGQARIMEYRLVEGPPLLLAVANSLADEVRHVLPGPDNR